MNTDLTVHDQLTDIMPITMTSKEIAEFLGKEHKNVVRDIKIMMINLIGGDDFINHRITGGLTTHEYTKRNMSDLYDELMSSKDESHRSHVLFQGFKDKKDLRGYTTKLVLNKIAVTTFAARNDTKHAFRLATYVDYLEDEARKKEIEAITKRVENIYRVKEVPFTEMSPSEQTTVVQNIRPKDLNNDVLNLLIKKMVGIIGDAVDISNDNEVDKMKQIPQSFVSDDIEIETDILEIENDNMYIEPDSMKYWTMYELARQAPGILPWLYTAKILRNGKAKTCSNYMPHNKYNHMTPYSLYQKNGMVKLVKYRHSGRIQTVFTLKGLNSLVRSYKKYLRSAKK